MANNVNIVISGKYSGRQIAKSPSRNCAYIQGENIYINKLHVKSVNDINKSSVNSYSDAALGTVLFGTGGAALGANQKQMLLELEWNDGGTSLIKVSPEMHEAIIVGMYETISQEAEASLKEIDSKANTFANVMAFIIVGSCTLLYLIAGIAGS